MSNNTSSPLIKQINHKESFLSVQFPYSQGLVERIKAIPGGRWDNDAREWQFKVSPANALLLIDLGNQFQFLIDSKVYELARLNGKNKGADRSVLYEYQKVGVDFMHKNMGTCLIADDMGLGKTIEALWYAKEADLQSILIVCPASVLYKWQDETKRWTGWEADVIKTGKQVLSDARVMIMSYAIMVAQNYELTQREFDLIIFDECQAITGKSRRADASKNLIAKSKLFLSGTPFLNRPIELYPILNHIDPFQWSSYWSYAKKYAGAEEKQIYTRQGIRKFWDVSGASNLDDLKKRIQPVMLRRTKQEVLTELPDLTRVVVPVNGMNQKSYKQEIKLFQDWMRENSRGNALAKLTRLRQLIGISKIAPALELAEEVLQGDPKRKLVLYAHHKAVVEELVAGLKEYGVDTIVGDDNNQKRADTMNAFQNKSLPRVLVISQAGGEGVDLYRADTIIFVEYPWNSGKLNQAEGRLHRNGQKQAVVSYHLIAKNTIDEQIYELINSKRDVFDAVIGESEITTKIMEVLC